MLDFYPAVLLNSNIVSLSNPVLYASLEQDFSGKKMKILLPIAYLCEKVQIISAKQGAFPYYIYKQAHLLPPGGSTAQFYTSVTTYLRSMYSLAFHVI
jgi:hypothetical protein